MVKTYATEADDLSNAETAGERNRKLNDVIFLIDRNYATWEKRLYEKKAFTDFFGSISVIGINAAGGLTGGAELKSILHAISGGIESTKTAIDKDVLQNQNMLAIIAKMRALRTEKLKPLLLGMQKPISDYPMSLGLVDLGEYYSAGSFVAALQDITAKSGKEKTENDQENQEIKEGIFGADTNTQALRDFLKADPKNRVKLKGWLDKNGIAARIPEFLDWKQYASKRAKAVNELVSKESTEDQ